MFSMMKALEARITFRILFLTISLFAASYLFLGNNIIFSVIIIVTIIYQVYALIRFINKSNQELAQFILSVRYRDFSQYFNENEPSVKELRKAFNQLNQTFKQLNIEKETQYLYLKNILELVNTGIISYDSNGEIKWMNESLKKLLGTPYLKNIKSLINRDRNLYETIVNLNSGESRLTEIFGKENRKVLLSASSFLLEEEIFTIIAFQNINQAIQETETLAWQKLLRVLNHEIMNSIAPIASLADTLKTRLNITTNTSEFNNVLMEDLSAGIEVIRARSQNLLHFAETYRNFNKISQPKLSEIYVMALFENIEILLDQRFIKNKIDLDIVLKDPDIKIIADVSLIEQVLLNLVINSIEAVEEVESPCIHLSAYISDFQKPVIEISDNGSGIPAELLENIFIPFFTTKKNGNGIGLSLSQQIMQMHNGKITVKSVPEKGSIFKMIF